MIKMVLASKNRKKLHEMQTLLEQSGVEVVLQSELGVDVDVDETGSTFAENAELKAKAVAQAAGMAAIADDSGIVVDALDGSPGIYSARYGGDACKDDVMRYELLLREMESVPAERRTARFVCAIACVFPDGTILRAEDCCEGAIAYGPKGEGGFGYDPIFLVAGTDRTMAELSEAEKNAVSHRGKAIRAFAKKLEDALR